MNNSSEPEAGAKVVPCKCDDCIHIARAKHDIDHGCDGPITAFVLISRACRLVEKRKYDSETIANALHAALRKGVTMTIDTSDYNLLDFETTDVLSPKDLGCTSAEYADAIQQSVNRDQPEGHVAVRGRRVYAMPV